MSVHPQMTEAKSNFVRKERKVREEKQGIFVSLRSSRPSRADAFASVFAWSRNKSNHSPQMNANERQSFAFHLRSLRPLRTGAFAFVVLIGVAA